jgi:nucleoside-diphosphate-sugar epimerase
MAASRLGLFSILYEFIDENRTLWMVGSGHNRYQFIYAGDLIAACRASLNCEASGIFNIGSDDVKTLREVYQYVIDRSGSRSKLRCLPVYPTIAVMKLCHWLKISPLGVYHYKMIAESFIFDTTRIKNTFGWKPTKNNEEILWEAYEHYAQSKQQNQPLDKNKPAHLRPSRMGIIRLLKWLS